MKKLIGILAFTVVISFGQGVMAQNYKFGHINSDELFMQMPERDTLIAQLEAYQTELSNMEEIMQVEFNNKYNDYINKADTFTNLVRTTKEEELQSIQEKITNFRQRAQQDMQQKQAELTQPVLQKAEKAIKDVAKENGYTYIFDLSRGPIIYFDEAVSIDILPLVKAKLGIE